MYVELTATKISRKTRNIETKYNKVFNLKIKNIENIDYCHEIFMLIYCF